MEVLKKDNLTKQNVGDRGNLQGKNKKIKRQISRTYTVCLMLHSNILQQSFLEIKITN